MDPDALAAWDAARTASGRKEMGAWVRAVVEDVLGTYPPGQRPGDVPRVPEVNAEAYAHLTAAANNLNQLTRYSHQDETLHPEVLAAVRAVVAAAMEVRGVKTQPTAKHDVTEPGAVIWKRPAGVEETNLHPSGSHQGYAIYEQGKPEDGQE
ncbi:hypothetical protein AB1207_24055 [Kineococcus endophyticus]|uniref:Bacterial mobilisation domain-containing protein n=1 Tax=Kineococcus endophyticus TaxID=1181883 RepID=A0ABV3PDV7_9ACTN